VAQAPETLEREPAPEGGREWEREAHEQADEYLAEHPAKAVDRTRDARAD
jgi:hypothetical protein